jgi:outer membrane protein assembly factor BamD (BamD/ComL family)
MSKDGKPAATPAADAVASARAAGPSRRAVLTGKREAGPAELQLLSRARQSDAQGDYAEVLAVVADHERRYPAGRLSEEREVLRVKALVGLGRASESRQAAARFRRQFPRSVLLQKIDDLLASLP